SSVRRNQPARPKQSGQWPKAKPDYQESCSDVSGVARFCKVLVPATPATGRIWIPPPSWKPPAPSPLRGTSGERAGERDTFHRIGAANWNPLSPLLRRGGEGIDQRHGGFEDAPRTTAKDPLGG